jgi:hypothetical protein
VKGLTDEQVSGIVVGSKADIDGVLEEVKKCVGLGSGSNHKSRSLHQFAEFSLTTKDRRSF